MLIAPIICPNFWIFKAKLARVDIKRSIVQGIFFITRKAMLCQVLEANDVGAVCRDPQMIDPIGIVLGYACQDPHRGI